jgi:hypothetical protein
VETLPGKSPNESTDKQITASLDLQLQAKNVKKTAGHADLLVAYQIVADKNKPLMSFNPDGQWQAEAGTGIDAPKSKGGAKTKGALVVDLYDQKTMKLVWRGFVGGSADSRHQVNYIIGKGLATLFFKFPPQPH